MATLAPGGGFRLEASAAKVNVDRASRDSKTNAALENAFIGFWFFGSTLRNFTLNPAGRHRPACSSQVHQCVARGLRLVTLKDCTPNRASYTRSVEDAVFVSVVPPLWGWTPLKCLPTLPARGCRRYLSSVG